MMSVSLDHDYCEVFSSDTVPQREMDEIGEIASSPCLAISDPNTSCDTVSMNSLSPAHSIDSGVDAGMEDFLADIASSWKDDEFGFYSEDFKDLEAILKLNDDWGVNGFRAKDVEWPSEVPNRNTTAIVATEMKQTNQEGNSCDDPVLKRNRKNAIAARENRQKKKMYVEGLQNEVTKLKQENCSLKFRNETMTTMILKLRDELKYLRSVLENQSTISLLLKSVASTPGISLSSSLLQPSENEEIKSDGEKEDTRQSPRQSVARGSRKRKSLVLDSPPKRSRGASTLSGGVCLHVSKGKVSLELCAKCEKQASQGDLK